MKILFVCHGNICRSPMAQSIMQNLVDESGLADKILIDSRATHTDEIGESPYYETKRVLKENGVPLVSHKATLITKDDFDKNDLILIMDDENLQTLKRNFGDKAEFSQKVKFLREFADENLNGSNSHKNLIIADPYYTRNFEKCYADIKRSCIGLLEILNKNRE